MHGSMDLANIEEQVRHRIPRMWPLLAPWLRIPGAHIYKDSDGVLHEIVATTGVDQGCPGSSILACLGIAPVHKTLYTYLLMQQDQVKTCLEAVAPALVSTGCCLKLTKCGVFSPGQCDTSSSGIQRLDAPPMVLRQPLGCMDGGTQGPNQLREARRAFMHLKGAGLSKELTVSLARSATSGDAVYLEQCQPLTVQQGKTLVQIVLDGVLDL